MEEVYNYKKIEKYVQKYWINSKIFNTQINNNKKKYYCLSMLPYPSGNLHMGHVRNYTISDVIARYQRMIGKNVLHPIGWDAFGLPAEEAAIKHKLDPQQWTQKNIQLMKKQLCSLGYSYDWNKEINTSDPKYYKWEQWFFIQLYKKKLVYKKKEEVFWCSYDQTVLANEQVINGTCWRCQNTVSKKYISQWFLKITNYAEELLNELKNLHEWPKKVIRMQEKWIGKSQGIEILFNIEDYNNEKIKIFTTKPETIMEVTFLSLSPLHNFIKKISKKHDFINKFLKKIKKINILKSTKEEHNYIGLNTNIFAIHPITNKKIPIWIANFVKQDFGTGAVMSVPNDNYSKIDYLFALKNNISIKTNTVLSKGNEININHNIVSKKSLFNNDKNSDSLTCTKNNENAIKILLEKKIAKKKTFFRIKDWNISRQRYWGTPIPIATTNTGEKITIPENQLPVLLPYDDRFEENNSFNLLKENKSWINIEINGVKAKRETDTFDTFMESSWYYIRYTNPHFEKNMVDSEAVQYWLPVDQYIGGIEHATMHLLYFRFFHKLLRDFKLIQCNEPVKKLICQGMVLSDTFYYIDTNKRKHWVHFNKVKKIQCNELQTKYVLKKNNIEVKYIGKTKMSKSKNNGVDPALMIKKYGADTIRLFMMFASPVENALEWKENGVQGIFRFLNRLWKLVYLNQNLKIKLYELKYNQLTLYEKELLSDMHLTIMKVSENMHNSKCFNTTISSIMVLVKKIESFNINSKYSLSIKYLCLTNIVKMLYPFTPHICFVMWEKFLTQTQSKNIDFEQWPRYNTKYIIKSSILVIQINGKKKAELKLTTNLSKNEILKELQNNPKLKIYLKEKKINKIVFIRDKIFNIVIKK
ncbi:Leucine--tRNA ligase [Buchnera aphidicola (Thelaxes suberi)]